MSTVVNSIIYLKTYLDENKLTIHHHGSVLTNVGVDFAPSMSYMDGVVSLHYLLLLAILGLH